MSKSLMSSAEYVEKGGACPACGSDSLSHAEIDWASGSTLEQPVSCSECGASWQEVYSLTGFTNFDKGETDER